MLPIKRLALILILCCCITLYAETELPQVKQRFGAWLMHDLAKASTGIGVEWVPEISYQKNLVKDWDVQAEYSLQSRILQEFPIDSQSTELRTKSYRAWLRLANPYFELRGGLQRLSFGSAVVLRPLQWFDRVNPLDQREETEGVEAVLMRFHAPKDISVWTWLIHADADPIGTEIVGSKDNTMQSGGMLRFPMPLGETGFCFHKRKLENSADEKRFGFNMRMDSWLGLWTEASLSHLSSSPLMPYRDMSSATLGMDYTFGWGSGLYAMLETNVIHSSNTELTNLHPKYITNALMLNYPMGLLDALSILSMYEHKSDRSVHSLIWRRNYDYLSIEASITHDLGKDFMGNEMRSLHLNLYYNI